MDLDAILSLALRRGAAQSEVFAVESVETPVRFEANRLKGIDARRTSGVALRLITPAIGGSASGGGGRIGFASSTKPLDGEAIEELVAAALETAPFGPEARFDFPGKSEAPAVAVFDPAIESAALDGMIETGKSVIDAVRRAEPELLCDAQVRRSVQTVTLANSNGGGASYRRSLYSVGVQGTLIRGTDMLFVGDVEASCRPDLDLAALTASVVSQLEHSRRMATVRTGELPVIFTPLGVAGALAMPLSLAFSGRMVHLGQSPLAGCLGKEMYDRRVSVWDDATLAYRPGARPFDDEGVPSRRVALIERGVVSAFLYDLQSAGLAGAQSTGSAGRGLTTQPSIANSCLVIGEGEARFEEMVRGIKEGLVVEDLMGAGQGNVIGGDFSGNVLLGYKIENGEIVGRVKDTMVAGNVHEALRRLVAIGSEGRWVGGSLFTPPLWFEGLTVSAKG
ncbi:MAG TPA: metallopeptidase TldD-related protein [Dehalococcoidia bacterium]|nr:metallopeptidase TldD-related protein [Dehalococcoidia bacterium]